MVHGALQQMHRLAAVQQRVHFAAELRDGEVVAQKNGTQELSQFVSGRVHRVPPGGAAQACDGFRSREAALADGGEQAQQLHPAVTDLSQRDLAHDQPLQRLGRRSAPRHEHLALGQLAQANTQVEAQQLGNRHGCVGVAMGVDGQEGQADLILAPRAIVCFDAMHRGRGLPVVDDDGLVVKQRPGVEHVHIDTDPVLFAAVLHARRVQVPRGIERHRV